MEPDYQEGRRLCRLKVAFSKSQQGRPGIAPAFFFGLFFTNALLYKALSLQL
jgi:hypothetical protein